VDRDVTYQGHPSEVPISVTYSEEINMQHCMKKLLVGLFLYCATNATVLAESETAGTAPPKSVLFSNVNIFDGKTNKLQKDMHVLVFGNKISEISSEPLAVIQSTNMTVIDGKHDVDAGSD
jgi:hypothetical protein